MPWMVQRHVTLSLCIWLLPSFNTREHKRDGRQCDLETVWLLMGLLGPEDVTHKLSFPQHKGLQLGRLQDRPGTGLFKPLSSP